LPHRIDSVSTPGIHLLSEQFPLPLVEKTGSDPLLFERRTSEIIGPVPVMSGDDYENSGAVGKHLHLHKLIRELHYDCKGRTVCNNGQEAGGYNRSSGTAWKSEKNQAGVTTTQTSKGGEAKTRNGKGVYKSPNGKTCVKTASNQGCN
jgi:hypothetical protein